MEKKISADLKEMIAAAQKRRQFKAIPREGLGPQGA